jgi:hypothetical protein
VEVVELCGNVEAKKSGVYFGSFVLDSGVSQVDADGTRLLEQLGLQDGIQLLTNVLQEH